jgi:hypothetical protein
MATKLAPGKIIGPFKTVHLPHFEKGKARDIELTLYPEYVEIRAIGIPERYHVPYGTILTKGAEMEVAHRIKRGALSGPK